VWGFKHKSIQDAGPGVSHTLQPPLKQEAEGADADAAPPEKVDISFRTSAEPQAGQVVSLSAPDFCSFSKGCPQAAQWYSKIGMANLLVSSKVDK
jgi:hypothetical protein